MVGSMDLHDFLSDILVTGRWSLAAIFGRGGRGYFFSYHLSVCSFELSFLLVRHFLDVLRITGPRFFLSEAR